DFHVTGVQTCALPIYRQWRAGGMGRPRAAHPRAAGAGGGRATLTRDVAPRHRGPRESGAVGSARSTAGSNGSAGAHPSFGPEARGRAHARSGDTEIAHRLRCSLGPSRDLRMRMTPVPQRPVALWPLPLSVAVLFTVAAHLALWLSIRDGWI